MLSCTIRHWRTASLSPEAASLLDKQTPRASTTAQLRAVSQQQWCVHSLQAEQETPHEADMKLGVPSRHNSSALVVQHTCLKTASTTCLHPL